MALYSELLKTPIIKKALDSAGVGEVPSILLLNGDFVTDLTERDAQVIIDSEILHRRKYREYLKEKADLEEKMKPYKLLEAKAEKIRPHFQALIEGKWKYPYSTVEQGAIDYRSEQAAKKYNYDPESGEVQSEDLSGLSELERMLKEAGSINISGTMSLEEIAQREFLDAGYSAWLK